jgi:hypothetical protein
MASKKKLKARIAELEDEVCHLRICQKNAVSEISRLHNRDHDFMDRTIRNWTDKEKDELRQKLALMPEKRICKFCKQAVAPHDWGITTRSHESCFDEWIKGNIPYPLRVLADME